MIFAVLSAIHLASRVFLIIDDGKMSDSDWLHDTENNLANAVT